MQTYTEINNGTKSLFVALTEKLRDSEGVTLNLSFIIFLC